MKIFNIAKDSFKNLWGNKLRSILTMLGIIIGIASVIVLVGIGNGSSSIIKSQIKSLGTDVISVSIFSQEKSLKNDDIKEMINNFEIDNITSYTYLGGEVNKEKKKIQNSTIIGTDENYSRIRNLKLKYGRNISRIDLDNRVKVCVIGAELNEKLFQNIDSVGEKIKIDGDEYTVVGIFAKQGSSMGIDIDNTIIVPLSLSKKYGNEKSIKNLYVKAKSEENIDKTILDIKNYIKEKIGINNDEYTVTSETKSLEAMNDVNDTFTILLGGIASISLIVGGIGVMNVMLVSVIERTKEIGIRKALGAQKTDILFQFLVESLILSLIGGGLGIILGIVLGNLSYLLNYTFEYSNEIVIISFTTSMLIGIIFGIFPAYKASKLNPIDALRQE